MSWNANLAIEERNRLVLHCSFFDIDNTKHLVMKGPFILLLVSLISTSISASIAPGSKPPNAKDIMVPIASGKVISLHDLAYIKVADYESVTGKKLSLLKKIEFKLSQRKLQNSMNEDGTFSNKRMEKLFKSGIDGETGFHLGGFALGLFLSLIGVLIAYLINDEKKSNRVRWAWIGAALFIFLFLLFRL